MIQNRNLRLKLPVILYLPSGVATPFLCYKSSKRDQKSWIFIIFKHFRKSQEGGKIVNIAYFAHNRTLTRDLRSGNTFV